MRNPDRAQKLTGWDVRASMPTDPIRPYSAGSLAPRLVRTIKKRRRTAARTSIAALPGSVNPGIPGAAPALLPVGAASTLSRLLEVQQNTKTPVVVPVVRIVPVATGGAAVMWIVVPGPAPQYTVLIRLRPYPSTIVDEQRLNTQSCWSRASSFLLSALPAWPNHPASLCFTASESIRPAA